MFLLYNVMSLKAVFFNLFLVSLELFMGIQGGNEHNNVPLQNVSERLSGMTTAYAQFVQETVANLEYILQIWNDLLLVEQNEIMRLRTNLGLVVRSISPTNQIRTLTLEELFKNNNIVIPVLKALSDYLKYVISNHQKLNAQTSNELARTFSQELVLLSGATAQLHLHLVRIFQRWFDLPFNVLQDIQRRRKWIDDVLRGTDLRMSRKFPTREELIAHRNVITPLVLEFHRFLSDIETKYLLKRSTPGQIEQPRQGGQEEQIGRGSQAGPSGVRGQVRIGGQEGQKEQAGPQTGPSGVRGQAQQGGQSGQKGHGLQVGPSGVRGQAQQGGQEGQKGYGLQVGPSVVSGQAQQGGQEGQKAQGRQAGQTGLGRQSGQGWPGWPAAPGFQGRPTGPKG